MQSCSEYVVHSRLQRYVLQLTYIKYYVPFCIQTPLLAQVAIFTSACFLTETGYLDNMATMSHKGLAIRMLNEHLRSKSSTTDVAISAVTQLILDEWYWGEASDLRAHLRGLREMIRLRGGFRNLGMDGIIAKLVITTDIAIALSFEIPPFLQNGPEFKFHDMNQGPLRICFNTPLVSPLVPFSTCTNSMNLHAATARILDDMRFLIGAVLSLPSKPSKIDLHKVHTTAAWIHERISRLPVQSPEARKHPAAVSDLLSPESAGDAVYSRQNSPASAASPRISRRNSPLLQDGSQPDSSSEHSYPHSRPQPVLPGPLEPEDVLYQAVRQAALIYSRVIMLRQSFRAVVTQNEFLQLWTTMWRVPLATWKGVLGVFCWIVLGITPTARETPHDRFVKSMLTISLNQMSIENWEIADAAMKAGLKLHQWLRDGEEEHARAERGGEDDEAMAADIIMNMAETATSLPSGGDGKGKASETGAFLEPSEAIMGGGSARSVLPKWQ
ncbi:hypothetical protein UCRPA7_970 [Phaeoacremonium minimum UCRPA7]|uniref:Uncharacterized protein n=1 Tax=Phaeoacremonium minimum (strain UCR-PA7) TaxID=1286976 RepID=R8BW08_PHAM7|nr:hypothetical protein UCRPA7_970 [Phaeoacremonium minimum UCRPA7]EOO03543.1 hypothetical protein UCRPA7_970 [Phaeoacremonium minimum UCRPA7]